MADWDNGVCGCFNDCSICIFTYCCPCYSFGNSAEAIGGNCCICGLVYFCPPFNCCARIYVRGQIREKSGISGSCCADCCLILCCWDLTLCQEAQEVKSLRACRMARE